MTKHKEYLRFYIFYIIMTVGIMIYYGITSGFSFSGSIIEEFFDMMILNEIGILLFVIIPGSLFTSARQGIVWLDHELQD